MGKYVYSPRGDIFICWTRVEVNAADASSECICHTCVSDRLANKIYIHMVHILGLV